MAPSSPATSPTAASLGGPPRVTPPASAACISTGSSQSSFWVKNRSTSSRIGDGSVWYSAASMAHRHSRPSASMARYRPT